MVKRDSTYINGYTNTIDEVIDIVTDIIGITNLATVDGISYDPTDIEQVKKKMQEEREMYSSAICYILEKLVEVRG